LPGQSVWKASDSSPEFGTDEIRANLSPSTSLIIQTRRRRRSHKFHQRRLIRRDGTEFSPPTMHRLSAARRSGSALWAAVWDDVLLLHRIL